MYQLKKYLKKKKTNRKKIFFPNQNVPKYVFIPTSSMLVQGLKFLLAMEKRQREGREERRGVKKIHGWCFRPLRKNLIDPLFDHFYIKATSFPRIFDVTSSQGIQ